MNEPPVLETPPPFLPPAVLPWRPPRPRLLLLALLLALAPALAWRSCRFLPPLSSFWPLRLRDRSGSAESSDLVSDAWSRPKRLARSAFLAAASSSTTPKRFARSSRLRVSSSVVVAGRLRAYLLGSAAASSAPLAGASPSAVSGASEASWAGAAASAVSAAGVGSAGAASGAAAGLDSAALVVMVTSSSE